MQSAPNCPPPSPTIRQSIRICLKPLVYDCCMLKERWQGVGSFQGRKGSPMRYVGTPADIASEQGSASPPANHPSLSAWGRCPDFSGRPKSVTHFSQSPSQRVERANGDLCPRDCAGHVRGRKMQSAVIICCRTLLMIKFGRR